MEFPIIRATRAEERQAMADGGSGETKAEAAAAGVKQVQSRHEAGTKQARSRHEAGTKQVLSRHDTDTKQMKSRSEADAENWR